MYFILRSVMPLTICWWCVAGALPGQSPTSTATQTNNSSSAGTAASTTVTLSDADVVEVYKTIGEVQLQAYIFTPPEHQPETKRPAIVFFFGGGWNGGDPKQFAPHCRALADRGMVAVTVDYRVKSRHDVAAVSCVTDAKSAVRWLRANAARLGIDAQRIVAAGGSAGGHLAACTAVVKQFDEPHEDAAISSVPNATALFNPGLVLAPLPGFDEISAEKQAELEKRLGVPAEQLSPIHQLRGIAPPTIIFHGRADTTVPYKTAELYAEAAQKAGGRCELIGFDDQEHGFFNSNRAGGIYFQQTLEQLDAFLVSLGYVESRK